MIKRRASFAIGAAIAACLMASRASAASWTDPRYLYRYVTLGLRSVLSKSDDYRRLPYHTIENPPTPFRFTRDFEHALPDTVEYKEGDVVKRVALDELLRSTGTHAFIVARDDKLLYENYFNGYQRDSINESWSVAKSFTSALVGIAIGEGSIRSIDDPITNYLPELKDRGFDAITIRHLLTMTSGIRFRIGYFPWDEYSLDYFYPDLRTLLLSDMEIAEPPGQAFHYTNYNPQLLGMILERVTHRTPSQYLQEKIWQPLGMEYPATWSTDSEEHGLELMCIALNARAIDFAKFGRLYLNKGNWNGVQVVPERWVVESTTIDPNDHRPWETFSRWRDMGGYYKYFWWGVSHGADDYSFMGIGTYGQFVFVSPKTRIVIVRTASEDGIDPPYWREVFEYIANKSSLNSGTD